MTDTTDQLVDEAEDELILPPEDAEAITQPGVVRVDSDEPEAEPVEETVTELTAEEREQFRYLLTVGRRTKNVEVVGHPVVISSLTCEDEIRIGAKVKEHRDSQGFARAYQCAMVAASVKSVDGESWDNWLEVNPDPDMVFDKKYRKAQQYHPLVVQYIYREVIALDSEFAELVDKLGKH